MDPRRAVGRLRTLAVVAACGLVLCCGATPRWRARTSLSLGSTGAGRLRAGSPMPARGDAWVVPERWRVRGLQYGTDGLVAAIRAAARRVAADHPGAHLGVADLSPRSGGASRWHSSHHSGRDVDLLFYSVGPDGRPRPPPSQGMIRYDGTGSAVGPEHRVSLASEAWSDRRFDDGANWDLVASLLSDPEIRVQWIFVADPLRDRLLRHAQSQGQPRELVEYAKVVMRQPGDAAPHDDHFHVRIYCSRVDRPRGCVDTGPVWQHEKKTHKYVGPERYDPVSWRASSERRD